MVVVVSAVALQQRLVPAPRFFAKLHQFGQHFQYFTVSLWKNTHVKQDYLIYPEMW